MSVNIRENINAIIKGIQENKILEIFEKYYADDVVMYEKGDSTNRVGKDQNRKAEEAFVNNATIHEAKRMFDIDRFILKVLVDGNNTAYEMYMDFTYGGHNIKKTQWAIQQWNNNGLVFNQLSSQRVTAERD
ncbi:hypothetical protein PPL_07425 [Heterostelium album PN500]|uniref:Nuclear transport factor 2 family protein n=1 Tax=Heterostelium pallidum (strain ATCC 26659 / Pp 5 / PN500) TaxID=670386 RepID=D3BFX4_HETP5|nr:hypothetical protein PPL_07425 [Heterostelium album PN500]EFA79734.1 hypothetical protein PPL_07425 [Heterostelium album PN500]|eukprot:XP_020431855.1 hypothetical protein PPL_07425 [Heterostelium album PN500]